MDSITEEYPLPNGNGPPVFILGKPISPRLQRAQYSYDSEHMPSDRSLGSSSSSSAHHPAVDARVLTHGFQPSGGRSPVTDPASHSYADAEARWEAYERGLTSKALPAPPRAAGKGQRTDKVGHVKRLSLENLKRAAAHNWSSVSLTDRQERYQRAGGWRSTDSLHRDISWSRASVSNTSEEGISSAVGRKASIAASPALPPMPEFAPMLEGHAFTEQSSSVEPSAATTPDIIDLNDPPEHSTIASTARIIPTPPPAPAALAASPSASSSRSPPRSPSLGLNPLLLQNLNRNQPEDHRLSRHAVAGTFGARTISSPASSHSHRTGSISASSEHMSVYSEVSPSVNRPYSVAFPPRRTSLLPESLLYTRPLSPGDDLDEPHQFADGGHPHLMLDTRVQTLREPEDRYLRSQPGVVGIGEGWAGGPQAGQKRQKQRGRSRWARGKKASRHVEAERDPLALWAITEAQESPVGSGSGSRSPFKEIWNRSRQLLAGSSKEEQGLSGGDKGISRVKGFFSRSRLNLVSTDESHGGLTKDAAAAKQRKQKNRRSLADMLSFSKSTVALAHADSPRPPANAVGRVHASGGRTSVPPSTSANSVYTRGSHFAQSEPHFNLSSPHSRPALTSVGSSGLAAMPESSSAGPSRTHSIRRVPVPALPAEYSVSRRPSAISQYDPDDRLTGIERLEDFSPKLRSPARFDAGRPSASLPSPATKTPGLDELASWADEGRDLPRPFGAAITERATRRKEERSSSRLSLNRLSRIMRGSSSQVDLSHAPAQSPAQRSRAVQPGLPSPRSPVTSTGRSVVQPTYTPLAPEADAQPRPRQRKSDDQTKAAYRRSWLPAGSTDDLTKTARRRSWFRSTDDLSASAPAHTEGGSGRPESWLRRLTTSARNGSRLSLHSGSTPARSQVRLPASASTPVLEDPESPTAVRELEGTALAFPLPPSSGPEEASPRTRAGLGADRSNRHARIWDTSSEAFSLEGLRGLQLGSAAAAAAARQRDSYYSERSAEHLSAAGSVTPTGLSNRPGYLAEPITLAESSYYADHEPERAHSGDTSHSHGHTRAPTMDTATTSTTSNTDPDPSDPVTPRSSRSGASLSPAVPPKTPSDLPQSYAQQYGHEAVKALTMTPAPVTAMPYPSEATQARPVLDSRKSDADSFHTAVGGNDPHEPSSSPSSRTASFVSVQQRFYDATDGPAPPTDTLGFDITHISFEAATAPTGLVNGKAKQRESMLSIVSDRTARTGFSTIDAGDADGLADVGSAAVLHDARAVNVGEMMADQGRRPSLVNLEDIRAAAAAVH